MTTTSCGGSWCVRCCTGQKSWREDARRRRLVRHFSRLREEQRSVSAGQSDTWRWKSKKQVTVPTAEIPENHWGYFSQFLWCVFFLTEWTHSSLWSRDKQFSGAVWQTCVRGSGWREGRVVSEKQSGTTGVLLQTEQVCINLRKMSKGTESETAVFGLISVASVPLSGCEDAVFPPVVVSWHSVGRYLGQLLLICLCLCIFLI